MLFMEHLCTCEIYGVQMYQNIFWTICCLKKTSPIMSGFQTTSLCEGGVWGVWGCGGGVGVLGWW